MSVRYSLETIPQGRVDGSGYVDHNVMAQDNSTSDWTYVPGYHKTFSLPADEIAMIMAMPDDTPQEKQAKNLAYKNLMVEYAEAVPIPLIAPQTDGWSAEDIEQYRSNYDAWQVEFNNQNDAAEFAADDLNTYITVTLGQEYPVAFNL